MVSVVVPVYNEQESLQAFFSELIRSLMSNRITFEIIFVDDFGNVHTNLLRHHLQPLGVVTVRLCGTAIEGMVGTFGERPVGSLIALYGTEHDLTVSVVNGNAQQRLGAKVGDVVEVDGR